MRDLPTVTSPCTPVPISRLFPPGGGDSPRRVSSTSVSLISNKPLSISITPPVLPLCFANALLTLYAVHETGVDCKLPLLGESSAGLLLDRNFCHQLSTRQGRRALYDLDTWIQTDFFICRNASYDIISVSDINIMTWHEELFIKLDVNFSTVAFCLTAGTLTLFMSLLAIVAGYAVKEQTSPLSLVEISRDTVFWLVDTL